MTDLLHDKINSLKPYGEVNFDDSHIEFNVHPSSTVGLFQFLPFSSPVPLPQISLKQVTYTIDTSELTVDTHSYGSQTIIPDILSLQDITLSFSVVLRDVSTLVVTFTGDFVLGGVTIPVEATYTHASRNTKINTEVPGLTVNLQAIATQLTGLDLPSSLHRSFSVPSFAIHGKISSESSELVVSATGGSKHVYIIYTKTDKPRKAIAIEMSNIKLASVLDDIVGLDISGIPYFGTTVLPTIALKFASGNIYGLSQDIFASSPLLNTLGSRIRKGLRALVKFTFYDNIIRLQYTRSEGETPTFFPIPPGSLNLQTLISAIPKFDLRSVPLPPGISDLLNAGIDEFSLNLKGNAVRIVISYLGSLTFFDGLLSVHNPKVIMRGPTGGIKINVDGDLSISGSDFDVSIKRDDQSGKYILRAQANELPIASLISQFKSEVLPSELNSLLGSLPFFSFSIEDPSISFPLFSSPLQIQLEGTPVISGYNALHLASVVIRQGGRTLLVQGFELGSLNLASFLKSITGFNFNSIAILNQELEAAILISPMSLPDIHLTGDKLSEFSITKGLSVQANMMFPPGCSSDALCAVAQSLLGADTQLNLHGTIASVTSFTLVAGVSNINLGNGILMSQAGLEIEGGTTNSIGVVGAVDLSNPDITLTARISLSTSGVVLEMTMSGCWENAFGASWLDICSLQSSVAMFPGVTLTGLSLGGEVHIGKKSCGTPLVATGFVGIDVITPTNNYYYVNIQGSTTVSTVLSDFCINIDVPAPLAQSGFPRGFISSFSLAGVELPHVPLSIPQGYRLNGTLNILGLEASADVTIGLPNDIDFAVALPPINVGGLLRMSVSSSDQSRGPFLNAMITLLPSPSINIEAIGYLSVLGISLETTLTVTNTQYIFNIQGRMLDLVEANLHIAASYRNIQQATFQVQGSFTNNLYDALENLIKNTLSSAGDTASLQLDAVQRELDRVRAHLNRAKRALRGGQNKVDDAQSAFDASKREIHSLSNKIKNICSTESCGKGA